MFKKILLATFIAATVGFGGVVEAQTTTAILQSPNAQKLAALEVQVQLIQMELIKQLIAQVTVLQEQLNRLLEAQGQVSVSDRPISQKPAITNVNAKASFDWEILAGEPASIQGFNLSGVTKVLFNCCKPDYELRPTSVSDSIVTFNVPADYAGKDVVQLWVTGRDGLSDYYRVKVLVPDSNPASILKLTSPRGGETYGTDIPELNIKYRSKGLKGEEVIAYLHKSNKHYSDHQRSKTVTVSSDSGNIVMGMQKGGAQTPGKYKVTICALIPGKDFCRESGSFELVASETDYSVNIKFIPRYNSVYGVHAELSYEIPKLRDDLTFWAEPEAYCNDVALRQGCDETGIFFTWDGDKGNGGLMNPYVKGGASYQLPTRRSLNKSFITTTTIDPQITNPDWVDIRFVLRGERGRELWSWIARLPFQFKG